MASMYPNFDAEMARSQLDRTALYAAVGEKFGRSSETVSNWFSSERPGEMPVKVAFFIHDEYFPELTVDYLFSPVPIYQ